jgi:hypothetical protein
MPNWSYTSCTVIGPDAEIERFRAACLALEPPSDDMNGIDFQRIIPMPDWILNALIPMPDKGDRQKVLSDWMKSTGPAACAAANVWSTANWGTRKPRSSEYYVEDGRHILSVVTAWSPPIPVFERIIAMFPALSFVDFYTRCEMGNYFCKGTISASGTDLHDDEEP